MPCKIWGFHVGDYEECHLLGYKNPVHTLQERYHFSASEHSRLILCKIWGFHGGDYEECHLLGYKNPVHTLQERYHVSATEHRRLILCKIWGFHGADYEIMPSSRMWCAVALVRTDLSEERIAFTIRMKKIRELWKSSVVTGFSVFFFSLRAALLTV
jgi:hypothetical protein